MENDYSHKLKGITKEEFSKLVHREASKLRHENLKRVVESSNPSDMDRHLIKMESLHFGSNF